MVAGGSRRHDRHCLVQLKIATDAPRLLGFAIYVWTIPAQVVQIDIASSATGASGRAPARCGCPTCGPQLWEQVVAVGAGAIDPPGQQDCTG
jgi:hypothetical protein